MHKPILLQAICLGFDLIVGLLGWCSILVSWYTNYCWSVSYIKDFILVSSISDVNMQFTLVLNGVTNQTILVKLAALTYTHTHIYIYMYIYICLCLNKSPIWSINISLMPYSMIRVCAWICYSNFTMSVRKLWMMWVNPTSIKQQYRTKL